MRHEIVIRIAEDDAKRLVRIAWALGVLVCVVEVVHYAVTRFAG